VSPYALVGAASQLGDLSPSPFNWTLIVLYGLFLSATFVRVFLTRSTGRQVCCLKLAYDMRVGLETPILDGLALLANLGSNLLETNIL
jgi:hypothetical protein